MQNTSNVKVRNGVKLICLPPSNIYYPLAGLTSIKSYLNLSGIDCKIDYLNLKIHQDSFFKFDLGDETKTLLPFFYLYNLYICNDKEKANLIKSQIINTYPSYFLLDKSLANELFEETITELLHCIDSAIDEILNEKPLLIGFTSKFYQWIPAAFCSYLIKEKRPDIKILIGGLSLKEAAISMIKVHSVFDYAIWGEGELPILNLYNCLLNKTNIEDNYRLAFRDSQNTLTTKSNNSIESFISLNSAPTYDVSDFTLQSEEMSYIPIESIRGCGWNKCKFCYLAQGYSYREKSNIQLLKEVRQHIEQYHISKFILMNNDIVGKDFDNFQDLLIKLKEIKKEHPDFEIMGVEIITQNLTKDIIKLMSESGILHTQIGFEAISQNLLSKINKQQSVADNLFFLKEAYKHGIEVFGLNIIIGTPDEDIDDIVDSMNTLYFFRFLYNNPDFNLKVVDLGVAHNSYYYRQLNKNNKLSEYNFSEYLDKLSESFFEKIDKYTIFEFISKKRLNPYWVQFHDLQEAFKSQKFNYKVQKTASGEIIYKEYSKRKLIKHLHLNDKITIELLTILQNKVLTFSETYNHLTNQINIKISEGELKKHIDDLYDEGIVYYTPSYSQITTIITI